MLLCLSVSMRNHPSGHYTTQVRMNISTFPLVGRAVLRTPRAVTSESPHGVTRPTKRASRRSSGPNELQPHQIDQELAPQVNHPTPGILHVARRSLLENTFVNVMRDLVAQILLDVSLNLRFIQGLNVGRINFVSAQELPMTLIKLPERAVWPLPVDPKRRRELPAIGQGIIPRRPNSAVFCARRNAQIVKRKITLLIEADRCLRAIYFPVEQSEKLSIIFPIPSGVIDVHKSFVLDFARDFTQRRERFRRGGAFRPKLFFLRKPQRSNPGENLQPRQKQPSHRGDQAPQPLVCSKINGQKSSGQDPERPGLLGIRIVESAQTYTEHGHAERKKKTKKHHDNSVPTD